MPAMTAYESMTVYESMTGYVGEFVSKRPSEEGEEDRDQDQGSVASDIRR